MKLVITIPAYNEERTIGKVVLGIPKKIAGLKEIRVFVIDDGSSDNTANVAQKSGATVIKNSSNMGLAYTFKRGLEEALRMKADVIVNTDADMQYDQKQISGLIKPILDGKADIILGSRFKGKIEYMPLRKRLGNRLATWAVRRVSGLAVSDAQTGFRAFSREAALRMNIQSSYTYTQETILLAAEHKLRVAEIPVAFRRRAEGESRLVSSIWGYAKRVSLTLVIGYLNYKPLKIFLTLGLGFFLIGLLWG